MLWCVDLTRRSRCKRGTRCFYLGCMSMSTRPDLVYLFACGLFSQIRTTTARSTRRRRNCGQIKRSTDKCAVRSTRRGLRRSRRDILLYNRYRLLSRQMLYQEGSWSESSWCSTVQYVPTFVPPNVRVEVAIGIVVTFYCTICTCNCPDQCSRRVRGRNRCDSILYKKPVGSLWAARWHLMGRAQMSLPRRST